MLYVIFISKILCKSDFVEGLKYYFDGKEINYYKWDFYFISNIGSF